MILPKEIIDLKTGIKKTVWFALFLEPNKWITKLSLLYDGHLTDDFDTRDELEFYLKS